MKPSSHFSLSARSIFAPLAFCVMVLGLGGCSSGPEVKTQNYANLQTSKTLEYDYDAVWRGVRAALAEYRIHEANEEDGEANTEWVYSTSNRRYVEVKVNGQPRRKYLQTRYKFYVKVKKQIIGTHVDVRLEEQVESINSDGIFKGWDSVPTADTSRANEMLVSIERSILSDRPR
jgi:uncharacterized lipoprotein